MTRKNTNATVRRAAFPAARLTSKQARIGRSRTTETPLRIRTSGLSSNEAAKEYVRQRAGFKLGKFALNIQTIEIRFKNESGPKGRTTIACTVTVPLEKGGMVVVERSAGETYAAFDQAIDVAERSIRRSLQRLRALKTRAAPGTQEDPSQGL